jgi:hypothetical protein
MKEQFSTWTAVIQNVFKPSRVRFLKSSQLMSFRLWQSTNTVTRFQVGPFEIGFKEMRPGRV